MSINADCWQYLLGVAEKIINAYADTQAIKKYYALKERMVGKCVLQSSLSIGVLSVWGKENSNHGSMRSSLGMSGSKKVGKDGRSKSKSRTRELQGGRVQTYSSKKDNQKWGQSIKENCAEYDVLNQLATILRNGEACPAILKTVRLAEASLGEQLYKVAKTIQDSLKCIYSELSKPAATETVSSILQAQGKNWDVQQLLSDNRWLIEKMQRLITENGTLRRMVGSKVC